MVSAHLEFQILQLEQLYAQSCEDRSRAMRAEARLDVLAEQERVRREAGHGSQA